MRTYKKMPSGYGIVQTAVMRLPELTIQSKAIYALLASYTGSKDYCFPSLQTIGNDVSLSRPMVIKYIKELEKLGLLLKTKLYPGNKMKTHNKYEIMMIEEELRCKAHLTSDVKPTLHPMLNTLNVGCKADLTHNNNSINNNISNKKKELKCSSLSLKKQDLFNEIAKFWESKTNYKLRQTKAFVQKWNCVVVEVPELTVKRAVERFLNDSWRMDKPKARTVSVLFKSVENIEIWGTKKTDSFKVSEKVAVPKAKKLEINTNTENSLIAYENIIKNLDLTKEEVSIWEKVKEQLRKNIKPTFFKKFIENIMPVVFDGDKVTAISRSGQIANHVNARYKNELQEAFFKQMGKTVNFIVLPAGEFR